MNPEDLVGKVFMDVYSNSGSIYRILCKEGDFYEIEYLHEGGWYDTISKADFERWIKTGTDVELPLYDSKLGKLLLKWQYRGEGE